MWSDRLVFCDCVFHSVCPLMDKDKKLLEASWWERLRGKLGLVLVGGAIPSNPLIQFSVNGRGCVPSLLFTWGQTAVEVMKVTWPPSNAPMQALLHSVPPTGQRATAHPCLHQRLPDTRRQVWVSLLWGHCSHIIFYYITYNIIILYFDGWWVKQSHQNLNSDSAIYTLKIYIIPFKNVFQSVTLLLFNTHGLSSHSCHPYQWQSDHCRGFVPS